jgi:hypothetical protein
LAFQGWKRDIKRTPDFNFLRGNVRKSLFTRGGIRLGSKGAGGRSDQAYTGSCEEDYSGSKGRHED